MSRRIPLALVAWLGLALPGAAIAQDGDAPETASEAPDGVEGGAQADADLEANASDEGASGADVPARATSSVEIDPRQDELEAEQAAMTAPRGAVVVVEDDEDEDAGESLDHEYQVGIRVGAGVPFFFGIRYEDGPPCDDDGSTFCFFVGSGVADLDLSFGVTPGLEITAMGRIGMVGVEPTENNVLQTGLGIRAYISPESLFKLFLGARAMLDFTPSGGGVSSWGDVDFGVRGEVGVQLDVLRYLGFYVQVGVNILFLRAFGISPDATGGVQVRFP